MNDAKRVEEKDFISGHTFYVEGCHCWLQRLSDSYGLILFLAGAGEISIGQEIHSATPGDLILMNPGFRHAFKMEPHGELLWFHFLPRPHAMEMLNWTEKIPGLSCVHLEDGDFASAQKELLEAHLLEKERLTGWHRLAVSLLEAALARGYRHVLNFKSEAEQWVQQAQKMLLNKDADIDSIALKCSQSRAAFYAKFKRFAGVSPRQYKESAVMRQAARLMESSSLSIAQIATQTGMPDPFYFSTRFRKYYGVSPREYRKRIQH